jgi:diguanylate cyclase (GGDEF)-like protein/PAS domain S-box-containing protein
LFNRIAFLKLLPKFSAPFPVERNRFLGFAGIYFVLWGCTWYSASLLDLFGISIFGTASLWFLPAGIRFCSILLLGWPGLALEMISNLIFSLINLAVSDRPIPPLLSAGMFWALFDWYALPIAYAVVILPQRRWIREPWDITLPGHNILFLFAALGASALSAFTGTYHLVQTASIVPAERTEVMTSWLIGDFIGIVTLGPLLLVRVWPGLHSYLRHGRWNTLRAPRSITIAPSKHADLHTALIVGLTLLLVFAMPLQLGVIQHFPLIALLLLLPLAAVTFRYGLRSAVLAVFLLDSGMVLIMAMFEQRELVLQYQLVMIAIALMGLWLGVTVEARNRLTIRYQDFASVSNDLLWETDKEGRLLNVSGRLASRIALTPGQTWRQLLEGGSQPHLAELEHALNRQQAFDHLDVALSSTGATRWIQINGLPLRSETGEWRGYRGTATDITDAHQAKTLLTDYNSELLKEVAQRTRELRLSNSELVIKEQHLQVLLAAAPVGVMELDNAECCRYLNLDGARLAGCSPENAQGRHLLDFVHPDDRDATDYIWNARRQSNDVQWLEFRLNRSNLWCSANWITLRLPDGSMGGTIMVLVDSTARRLQDERLWRLAHYDSLTDLPNRKLFWDRSTQAMSLAERRGSGIAMLSIDLDGFKAVNDSLGHAAGDVMLQLVAYRLKGRVRDSDTVARMGGDEFSVLMPDITDPENVVLIAKELVASLAQPFELPQGTVRISGCVGIGLFPQHAQTVESLARCADVAMYGAKQAGKNQVKVWRDSSDPRTDAVNVLDM